MERGESFQPDLEQETGEQPVGEEATEDVEAEANLEFLREEALVDAEELAEEIETLAKDESEVSRTTLQKIAGILSGPMARLRKMMGREVADEIPETHEISEKVKAEMVQLESDFTEADLRRGVLKLLKKLNQLKSVYPGMSKIVADILVKKEIDTNDAGVVYNNSIKAIEAFKPVENDPEQLALYDQLNRLSHALFIYHIEKPTKLRKDFEGETPDEYMRKLIAYEGIDPNVARQAAQRIREEMKKTSEENVPEKLRKASEKLIKDFDFVQPTIEDKVEEATEEEHKKAA